MPRALVRSNGLRRLARCLWVDRRGVAAIEFGLIAPFLVALLLGASEVALYLNADYRAAQMATTVADVVARYQTVTSEDIKAMLGASSAVIGATDFSANGVVILSSVSQVKAADKPTVAWQCKGGGSLAKISKVGTTKGVATLPNNLSLDAGDNIIIAEVYYSYTPGITAVMGSNTTFYKTSVFRPRLGALTTAPGC